MYIQGTYTTIVVGSLVYPSKELQTSSLIQASKETERCTCLARIKLSSRKFLDGSFTPNNSKVHKAGSRQVPGMPERANFSEFKLDSAIFSAKRIKKQSSA